MCLLIKSQKGMQVGIFFWLEFMVIYNLCFYNLRNKGDLLRKL